MQFIDKLMNCTLSIEESAKPSKTPKKVSVRLLLISTVFVSCKQDIV